MTDIRVHLRALRAGLIRPTTNGWRVELWWQLECAYGRVWTVYMRAEEDACRHDPQNDGCGCGIEPKLPRWLDWLGLYAQRQRYAAQRLPSGQRR